MRFVALVLLNLNHLGSCSHNLCAWRNFKITVQRQTRAKTNSKAMTFDKAAWSAQLVRFVALVLLNPNLLGSCSLYLCGSRKVQITDRWQTFVKTDAKALTT